MTNESPYADNLAKLCKSVDDMMEVRREVYRKFLAPWNIEKGENLRKQDERLVVLFRQLKAMLEDVHALYGESQRRQLDCYQTIGEQQEELTRVQLKLQAATKDYESLHDSYSQLIEQLESVSSLAAEIESLKAQLAEAKNGKSGKRHKK